MYVPNYIPDPLEVPGNVTEQPYLQRLRFVRRVTLLHFASLLAVAGLSQLEFPRVGLIESLIALSLLLVALDLVRIFERGKPLEALISASVLPILLVVVAFAVRELRLFGFPTWPFLAGPIASLAYSLLCGRDYSFVGNFLLSLIGSTVAVAALAQWQNLTTAGAAFALVANAVFLFYLLYDLASIQSRRRMGEALAAVTDLYRDVFNIFGYVVRVVGHWKKHRIWVVPKGMEKVLNRTTGAGN